MNSFTAFINIYMRILGEIARQQGAEAIARELGERFSRKEPEKIFAFVT